MPPKTLVVFRAFGFAFSASLLVALLALVRQGWFGVGDLKVFIIYTGIFSVLVAPVGLLAFRLLARLPVWLRYTAGGIVGLAVGVLFTIGNRLVLGPWFGAWSIPVLVAWLCGGLLGVAGAAGTRPRVGVARFAAEQLSFLCLLLVLSYGVPWTTTRITHDQELTVIAALWRAGDSPLEVLDPNGLLVPQDRELLARSPLRGIVFVRSSQTMATVRHPKARMLILLSREPKERVRLAQPDAAAILYWQDGADFGRYPEDTRVLDRAVELAPVESRAGVTGHWIEHPSGARTGGDFFNWNR